MAWAGLHRWDRYLLGERGRGEGNGKQKARETLYQPMHRLLRGVVTDTSCENVCVSRVGVLWVLLGLVVTVQG